jgi:hypothetical protein
MSGSPAITGFLIGFGMCEAGVVSFALNNHHVTHPAAIPNIAKNVPSIIDAFTLNFLSMLLGFGVTSWPFAFSCGWVRSIRL